MIYRRMLRHEVTLDIWQPARTAVLLGSLQPSQTTFDRHRVSGQVSRA